MESHWAARSEATLARAATSPLSVLLLLLLLPLLLSLLLSLLLPLGAVVLLVGDELTTECPGCVCGSAPRSSSSPYSFSWDVNSVCEYV